MPDPQPITLLHISDMQFGRNHRFGTLAEGDPDADLDTLSARLAEDLRGWLRISVVHHNVVRGARDDDENLRDASDLEARLGSLINLLLHGHTHEGKTAWIHSGLPVLSTGSAALNIGARPPEVPNQYQVIRIYPDRVERWARRYQPRKKSWSGDTDASDDGSTWHVMDDVSFDAVHATFGSTPAAKRRPQVLSRESLSSTEPHPTSPLASPRSANCVTAARAGA